MKSATDNCRQQARPEDFGTNTSSPDPDARILSGPSLAHVRSALMMVMARYDDPCLRAEMQAVLDSLNSGKPVERWTDIELEKPVVEAIMPMPVSWRDGPMASNGDISAKEQPDALHRNIRPRDTVSQADVDDLRFRIDTFRSKLSMYQVD